MERTPLPTIDPDAVIRAAGLVRLGKVFSLNLPLDGEPMPARPALERSVIMDHLLAEMTDGRVGVINDDSVEFPLQGKSHWDAFGHFGVIGGKHPGVYLGGAGLRETGRGRARTLGIETLAGGIATRAVVLDMVVHLEHQDPGWLPGDLRIHSTDIESCLRRYGLELRRGDVVLVHTGYEARLRAEGAHPREQAGVDVDTMPLWEAAQIFGLAADNISVEPMPPDLELHAEALTRVGLYLGEMWALEELVLACREHDVYEAFLTSAPLNITGAYGSPANALAIL